jgi:hypothetical protein
MSALEVALTRPTGVPERRAGEDHWNPKPINRPRRVTDDLAWLRRAIDEPAAAGLRMIDDDPGIRVWEVSDFGVTAKLQRLLDRGVLEAAGFELHDADYPETG